MQDRDLRARFRQGDPDAVREIYRAHGRLVYGVAHRCFSVTVQQANGNPVSSGRRVLVGTAHRVH